MILDPNHSHVYAMKAVCSLSNLEKGEKGTNLALFLTGKQQISDIHKNKEKILNFVDSIKTNERLIIHKLKYLQSVDKFKQELIQNQILFSL